MTMIKESYERLMMDVTEFDAEDVITTSGVGPGPGDGPPGWDNDPWETGKSTGQSVVPPGI